MLLSSETTPASVRNPPGRLARVPWWALAASVVALACVVYGPSLGGGFLWDDAGHVTAPELRGWRGLARIWFEPGVTQQYYPLLHSAFWAEYQLFGDNPFGYRLVSVLQHATAACLLILLLRRLALPGAHLAGFCFALHPVCVESVAWISEQKNTLSTVIYLAAALAYLRFEERRRTGDYLLASGLFLLALAAKTVTATLPASLLVLAWWRRPGLTWRDAAPLVPWLLLGATTGLFTAAVERGQIGAEGEDFALSPLERGLLAARVLWFYPAKLVWPAHLAFVYPRWEVSAADAVAWSFVALTTIVMIYLIRSRRRHRGALAVAFLYAGALFPALGFVNVYPFLFSYVADHFQYLAALPLFAAGACAATLLPARPRIVVRWGVPAALALMTWCQSHAYRSDLALFQTTLARNPAAWLAHNNLGVALVNANRPDEAVAHFAAALRLRPRHAEAANNLGDCLTRLGRPRDALPLLEEALRLRPKYPEAINNLGSALMKLNRPAAGIARFEEAIRLRPGYALAHFNLGLALANGGQVAEAAVHFERAVRLQRNYPEAELNWAVALVFTNRFHEAIAHFERALQLRPGYADAEFMYGRALALQGSHDAAIAHLRRAVELNPSHADGHLELGVVLQQVGRAVEAQHHIEIGSRLRPRPR